MALLAFDLRSLGDYVGPSAKARNSGLFRGAQSGKFAHWCGPLGFRTDFSVGWATLSQGIAVVFSNFSLGGD